MQSAILSSTIATVINRSAMRFMTVLAVSVMLMLCGCLQFHHHDNDGHLCMHVAASDHHADKNDIGSEPDECSLHLPSVTDQKRIECCISVQQFDILSDLCPAYGWCPILLFAVTKLKTEYQYPVLSDKPFRYICFRAPPCA